MTNMCVCVCERGGGGGGGREGGREGERDIYLHMQVKRFIYLLRLSLPYNEIVTSQI